MSESTTQFKLFVFESTIIYRALLKFLDYQIMLKLQCKTTFNSGCISPKIYQELNLE
jgi:hypothetical protein